MSGRERLIYTAHLCPTFKKWRKSRNFRTHLGLQLAALLGNERHNCTMALWLADVVM